VSVTELQELNPLSLQETKKHRIYQMLKLLTIRRDGVWKVRSEDKVSH